MVPFLLGRPQPWQVSSTHPWHWHALTLLWGTVHMSSCTCTPATTRPPCPEVLSHMLGLLGGSSQRPPWPSEATSPQGPQGILHHKQPSEASLPTVGPSRNVSQEPEAAYTDRYLERDHCHPLGCCSWHLTHSHQVLVPKCCFHTTPQGPEMALYTR